MVRHLATDAKAASYASDLAPTFYSICTGFMRNHVTELINIVALYTVHLVCLVLKSSVVPAALCLSVCRCNLRYGTSQGKQRPGCRRNKR